MLVLLVVAFIVAIIALAAERPSSHQAEASTIQRTLISAGEGHTCAVRSLTGNQSVSCWGRNTDGQLGNGSNTDSNTPVPVSMLTEPIAIAAGGYHTCALQAAGAVRCWGDNSNGQLGNGTATDSNTPVNVQGLSNAVGITAGLFHTCALLSNGRTACWGQNTAGQLGGGSFGGNSPAPITPCIICGGLFPVFLDDVTRITAGASHTCAVQADGTIDCWGSNFFGQVGDGSNTDRNKPTGVSGITDATAIAAGAFHTCAVRADGTGQCWGIGNTGALGNGGTSDSNAPVPVSGLSNAAAVTAGSGDSCAVLSSGTMRCWGFNSMGQLGDGTSGTNRTTPVTVCATGSGGGCPALSGVAHAEAGSGHTCAALADGSARCWGGNSNGQIGNGSNTNSSLPQTVFGLSLLGVVQISSGNNHTCVRTTPGDVYCWGANPNGQLGDGTTTYRSEPGLVPGLSDVVAVSAGGYHTCALQADSTVRCWGWNAYGQLGDGTNSSRFLPVAVPGLSNAVGVSAGGEHTCALLADGAVRCWGHNFAGQLGDGTSSDRSLPVAVSSLANTVALSAGGYHTCALQADSTVRCWGLGVLGQLGDGTSSDRSLPVAVSGLANAVAVSAGGTHSCALVASGTVWCWGESSLGRLGAATNETCFGVPCSMTPVAVLHGFTPFNNTVGIDLARYHTCAVRGDGTAWCWGSNNHGQLGTATGETCGSNNIPCSTTPVEVPNYVRTLALEAGGASHTCAVDGGSNLQCWGSNESGQLGDGTTTDRPAPVSVQGFAPPAQPYPGDTDGDGCPDAREQGTDQTTGGGRSYTNMWDYFNTSQDGSNRVDDVLAVINQYFVDVGEAGYDQDTDRTALGPDQWDLGPPNGEQRIDDVLAIIYQYFHDCS
jgi:alpha-tubulin suppressor-like RCC1 family protein